MVLRELFYIPKDDISRNKLREDLEVYGKGYQDALKVERCFTDAGEYWGVPIPYGLNFCGGKFDDQTPNIEMDWPDIDFQSWYNQEEVISKMVAHLKEHRVGMMQAACSFGKTICSIEIARRLKTNMLFACHKVEDVLEQAADTLDEIYPDIKYGWIKGNKKVDPSNHVTFASMQTLRNRINKGVDYLDKFGAIFCDEIHRGACKSWQTILKNVNSTYKMGMTATPRRSDNLHQVFFNYLGDIVTKGVKPPQKRSLFCPILDTKVSIKQFMDYRGQISSNNMYNALAESDSFNKWIVEKCCQVIPKRGRMIIVVKRISQMDALEQLVAKTPYSFGRFQGGMKKDELKSSAECDIICGTVSKIGEGFDSKRFIGAEKFEQLKPLNTMLIACPVKDSEQCIGRVGRGKGNPDVLIIHPVNNDNVCKGMFKKCWTKVYQPLNVKEILNLPKFLEQQ